MKTKTFIYFNSLSIIILLAIHSVTFAQNNKWILTMTKESGYNGQEWRTKTIFPDVEIKELWAKGYQITSLTYGEGKWAVVMSTGSKYIDQIMISDEFFPEDKINVRIDTMQAPSVADCIIKEQEEMKCCTVVIGRRGISKKEEFIFGSTSNRIIHEAKKCAVLVIE